MMDEVKSRYGQIKLFAVLAVLGTAAARLSVQIPHTEVFIEGRWIFGFIGFALLSRWWSALLLAAVLSIPHLSDVPLIVGFLGNMSYAVPCLVVIRPTHAHVLDRFRAPIAYALGWFVVVLLCYQAFNTPLVWAISAAIKDAPIWPAVLDGWRTQPFLIESLLVGLVSASIMAALRSTIQLRQTTRRLDHINRILLAIRNVNQLITEEKDHARLLDKACQMLVETRGFYNAWIALLDETKTVATTTVSAGFDGGFDAMARRLKDGQFPTCMREALAGNTVVVTADPQTDCPECLLKSVYDDRASLARSLASDGQLYGVFSVSVPRAYALDAEEQSLFNEVADDLAFALHKLEAERQLRRLERVVSTISQPMSFVSKNYRYLAVNDIYAELYDAGADQIVGSSVADFCGQAVFDAGIKPQLDRCLAGETVRYEVQVDFPGKGTRWMEMEYTPYRDENGEITGVVSHGLDITERKRAERELRESEARFRLTFDRSPIGAAIVSTDFTFQDVNAELCRISGYTKQELVGSPITKLVHPDDVAEDMERGNQLVMSQVDRYDREERCIRKDGQIIWIRLSVNVVRGTAAGSPHFLTKVQDITERKRAQDALRESEEKHRLLFDNADVMVSVYDRDGVCKHMNQKVAALFGGQPQDFVGKSFRELHPEASDKYLRRVREAIDSGVSRDYEDEVAFPTGNRWLLTSVHPIPDAAGRDHAAQIISQDVTERKRAEEALKESERLLNATAEMGKIGGWEHDLSTGEAVWTRPLFDIVQVPLDEEPPGTDEHLSYYPPEDREVLLQAYNRAVEEGVPFDLELQVHTHSGQRIWCRVQGEPVYEDGRCVKMRGTFQDITERKQIHEALRENEETLRGIFDTVPSGLILVDATGRVLFANNRMAELWGGTVEEIVGSTYLEHTHGSESVEAREKMFRLIRGEIDHVSLERLYQRKDGSTFWGHLSGRRVHHPDGTFRALVGVITDVTERRQAEEALRESEQRYKTLIYRIHVAVVVHDADTRIIAANPRAQELLRLTEDQILDKAAEDPVWVFAREDGEPMPVEEYPVNQVLATAQPLRDMLLGVSGPDGSATLWFLVNADPVLNERQEVEQVIVTFVDVTERTFAEEALHESETRYRTLFESAGEAIFLASSEVFLECNQKALDMYGCSRQELIGHSPLEFSPLVQPDGSDSAEKARQKISAALDGDPQLFEWQHRRADGTAFDAEVNLNRIQLAGSPHILAVVRDITDRKRAERELRESTERLRLALQAASMGTWEWDLIHDRVTWSPETMSIFGTDPEGFGGTYESYLGFAAPEERDRVHEVVSEFLRRAHESSVIQYEHEIVRGDGLAGWIEVRGMVFLDQQGQPARMTGVCTDITERKQAEEARQKLESQLRQAQKMEAIGQLTGGVAHDFNNMLQVINGATELALDDLEPDHPARESLNDVVQAGQRAAWLVSQLLLFSRRQIMRPEPLDLNETVADLLKMLGRVIGEHIQLQWHPGPQLRAIQADRTMIEQVLMNLCVNARDAMPGGGVLTIETHDVTIDEDYCVSHSWARPGHYALLTVSDIGCGMDSETIAHIFEPFFTTKGKGQGTGLGLATVYGIVKQHDGLVNVYSEPEGGSVFKLFWPCSRADLEQPDAVPEATAVGGTETILLAEDDEIVRRLAQAVLERAGYTVLIATNGREALSLFERYADEIDMALLDVVMPEMGGREAYERMRAVRPNLKAIFASGYSENAIHTNFVLDQGLIFIQKPFGREALLGAVREALDRE